MWQILIAILFLVVMNQFCSSKEKFPEDYTWGPQEIPSKYTDFPDQSKYNQYHDPYQRDKHLYPFAGYSLYGDDDIYPPINPGVPGEQEKWSEHVKLRPRGQKTLAGLDYNGLPSYSYRHYYGWPEPLDDREKAIRELGEK